MAHFKNDAPEIGTKSQIHVLVDPFALILTALSVSLFLNLGTFVDFDETFTIKALLGLGFLVVGVALSAPEQGGVGWVLDATLSQTEVIDMVIVGFSSFIFILASNIAVNLYDQLSIAVYASVVFVQMIAIAEEWAIRGYLLNLISNLTTIEGAPILMSSAIGATFHSAVYGNKSPTFLLIVFVSFCILGYLYATSTTTVKDRQENNEVIRARRIGSIMIGHTLVNTVAGLRGSVASIDVLLGLRILMEHGRSYTPQAVMILKEVLI